MIRVTPSGRLMNTKPRVAFGEVLLFRSYAKSSDWEQRDGNSSGVTHYQ
jgi:hypothetical protein